MHFNISQVFKTDFLLQVLPDQKRAPSRKTIHNEVMMYNKQISERFRVKVISVETRTNRKH